MSGGLDVEAEECTEEVQKEQKRVADWTLKQRNTLRKSKGKKRRGGLDVKAEECTEEVQREQERAVDWTLKRRKGAQKSKEENMYMETAARQASVPTD